MIQTLAVDVVDMAGHGMREVVVTINGKNAGLPNPSVVVQFQEPPEDQNRFELFVEQVIQSVSRMQRSIRVLRLWGHAVVWPNDVPKGKPILGGKSFTVEDVRIRRVTFERLTRYYSGERNTRFEFRGCGVANVEGLDLMKDFARMWGIRVHAAELDQGAGCIWDGPVVEAMPDGSLHRIGGVPYDSPY